MPRRPRRDKPGRLHHVINRGQDRRRIFRHRGDYRFFLSLLVRATRAGRIRLHAYCLMPNHFHLLAESTDGNLSATMQWVQFRYAAYFNRTRDHTGHVFGGRFLSFPVVSRVYLFVLIRYIDRNPWNAKERKDPLYFPWCSAFHHAKAGARPRWLERRVIDRLLAPRLARGEERAVAYRAVLRIARPDPAGDGLVEQRIAGRSRGADELDMLLTATPAGIAAWMRRRAGGPAYPTAPLALVDPGSILRAITALRREATTPEVEAPRGAPRDPYSLVEIGLLRDLVGLTYDAAAQLTDTGATRLRTRYALHRAALVDDDGYLQLVARTAHRGLAHAFGADVRSLAQELGGPGGDEGNCVLRTA